MSSVPEWTDGPTRSNRTHRSLLYVVIGALVLIGAVGFGVGSLFSNAGATASLSNGGFAGAVSGPQTTPLADYEGHALVFGDGKVTVDLYEDYICPACQEFQKTNGDDIFQAAEYGTIKLRFHPLGMLDSRSSSHYSTRAAAAMACSADDDKFLYTWTFHRNLMAKMPKEHSAGYSDAELARMASPVYGNAPPNDCITGERYVSWIAAGTKKAKAEGIAAVPTVFIDGKKVDASKASKELDKALGY